MRAVIDPSALLRPADLTRAQCDHGPGPHGPLTASGEQDHLLDHRRQRAEPDSTLGGQVLRVLGAAEGQMRDEASNAPVTEWEPQSQLPVETVRCPTTGSLRIPA
ncbi:hypothetical protein SAMN05216268_109310 [Streptomyces yunnanensis]|uniref:Uncharacterized protein n=2 Tax=Streptomyces TaxID=1883 RepID=A0A2N8P8F2_STRNR|nr:hypothetical protein AOB60_23260 [Streptomyces noursei]SHM26548.1 hypothetical protein SAMN05216268_109310 [Streptomyces yunnanensis]